MDLSESSSQVKEMQNTQVKQNLNYYKYSGISIVSGWVRNIIPSLNFRAGPKSPSAMQMSDEEIVHYTFEWHSKDRVELCTIWENTSLTEKCIFAASCINPLFRAPLLQVIIAAAIPLGWGSAYWALWRASYYGGQQKATFSLFSGVKRLVYEVVK